MLAAALALALQVVPSGPKPYIAQQDENNLPWLATVILLVENMTDTDRVIITRKRIDTSVLFLLSISGPCLVTFQILNFYTLSPSHQSLDACMEH
jgi:hypothetical protein